METLNPRLDINAFWLKVKQAPARVLMLDYDGTLAPFAVRRQDAVPYPGIREVLNAIHQGGHTRLVMVSGRWAEDVSPLLGLDHPAEVWGCHGWERLWPDGRHELAPMAAPAAQGLEEAAHLLGEMAQGNPELADRWERKPATVALHYRGMTHDLARQLEQQVVPGWRELAARSGLELKPFDGGVELVAPGVDKGRAVTTILNETPEAGVAAYLGDDLTDEDAFRALHEDTASHTRLAVFVRESHRNTLGDLWLRPPEELLEFLHRWHTEAQG